MSDMQLESCIGPPIQESFRRIYGVDEVRANEMASIFRNLYKEKYLYDAEVYSGMPEVINTLKHNGIMVMIATYKREDYTEKLLKKFGLWNQFDYVKGSDFDGRLKKSDIIKMCIEKSQCNREECIMIGDTFHDGDAAYEIGVDFLAVTYGFGFKAKESVDGAIFIADSVLELKDYFERLYRETIGENM